MEKRTLNIISRVGISAPLFVAGFFSLKHVDNDFYPNPTSTSPEISCASYAQTNVCESNSSQTYKIELNKDGYFYLGLGVIAIGGAIVIADDAFNLFGTDEELNENRPNSDGPYRPRNF